jgi:hypothetical protein
MCHENQLITLIYVIYVILEIRSMQNTNVKFELRYAPYIVAMISIVSCNSIWISVTVTVMYITHKTFTIMWILMLQLQAMYYINYNIRNDSVTIEIQLRVSMIYKSISNSNTIALYCNRKLQLWVIVLAANNQCTAVITCRIKRMFVTLDLVVDSDCWGFVDFRHVYQIGEKIQHKHYIFYKLGVVDLFCFTQLRPSKQPIHKFLFCVIKQEETSQ